MKRVAGPAESGVLSLFFLFFLFLSKKYNFRREEPSGDVMRMDQRDNTENKYTPSLCVSSSSFSYIYGSSTILYIYYTIHSISSLEGGNEDWNAPASERETLRSSDYVHPVSLYSSARTGVIILKKRNVEISFYHAYTTSGLREAEGRNKSFDIDKGILFLFLFLFYFGASALYKRKNKTGLLFFFYFFRWG
jgi:hypothetical protein